MPVAWYAEHVRDTGAATERPEGACVDLWQRRNIARPGVIGALIERAGSPDLDRPDPLHKCAVDWTVVRVVA